MFKNGDVFHYEYNGTVDVCIPQLYKTIDGLEENWRNGEWKECSCGNDEDVEIYSSYGNGGHWKGRACKNCMVITVGFSEVDEYGYHTGWERGTPEWAEKYYRNGGKDV